MLEGLGSVAWEKIPTAYDRGAQLPKLIKKLSSRSESVREKAYFELREEIAHQGHVQPEAALAVAPFLVELIQSSKVQDRDRLLWLLGDLAVFCRGAWDLLDLAPPGPGPDWILDALEKCEPETIPLERLVLAEATFGTAWQEKVTARSARLGPHQLAALEQAHVMRQRER